MKKSILFLLLIVTFVSCKKDDEAPQSIPESTEVEKLPPATQIGANTAGFLLNGVAVVAEGDEWSETNPYCVYDQDSFVLLFRQNITEDSRNIATQTLYISTNATKLAENTKYLIKEQVSGKSAMFYIMRSSFTDERYYTNTSNTGELYINKLDKENNIISGTFWFDAVDSKDKKVEIREGRFDVVYQGTENKN